MKCFIFLLAILFNLATSAQEPQSYAIFSQEPEKRISYTDLSDNNYFIEYQTKKKAIIYLELVKNDLIVAMAHQIVKSKNSEIVKFKLNEKIGANAGPGNGYILKLRMYEGENKNIKHLVSEVVIEDISLTRLVYTKL